MFRCLLVAVSVKFLPFLVLDVLGSLPFFQVFDVFGLSSSRDRALPDPFGVLFMP